MISPRKEWVLRPSDPTLAGAIASATGLPPLAAQVVANRGVRSPEEALLFIQPDLAGLHDPFLLRDMDRAADTLVGALTAGKPVAIHGDYDVDGITATAVLFEFLRALTQDVRYFIPERLSDGYGIRRENLEALRHLGTELVITVDCGVSNVEELAFGRSLGLDFIVTDHHPVGEVQGDVPVVDPHRPGCAYPNRDLAGVGVAFKLVQAVRERLAAGEGALGERARRFDPASLLDMVAIGTIGDVVPLTGENRIMVSHGLAAIRDTPRPGLAALKEVAGVGRQVGATAVAYYLAPRLNASGRLGKADRGVRLFLETDPARARELARELNEENRLRQRLEADILRQTRDLLDRDPPAESGAIVLASPRWHPGVIGVVAARLAEQHHVPAVLLAGEGERLKGSARSVPGLSLQELLGGCAEHLVTWGGHRMAAGLTVEASRIDPFRRRFVELVAACRRSGSGRPVLDIDLELGFRDLKMPLLEALETLEPHGCANPHPVFATHRATLTREPEVFGERHLRLHLSSGSRELRAVGFRMAHLAPYLWRGGAVDVAYTPETRRVGQRPELSLNIKDLAINYRVEDAVG